MSHDLERRITNLENKIRNFMQPCVQTQNTSGSLTASAQLSVPSLDNKITSDVPVHGTYGFWNNPMPGCQHTLMNLGGMDGNGRSIATHDERYRPLGLVAGDTCQGDANGQMIWLSGGNTINIVGKGAININAPSGVTITGNVNITGAVVATGNVTAGSIDLETHKHTNVTTGSGTSGGPTG
jgi:phage gp45-like